MSQQKIHLQSIVEWLAVMEKVKVNIVVVAMLKQLHAWIFGCMSVWELPLIFSLVQPSTQESRMILEPSYHDKIPADEATKRLKASGLEHCYLTHYCETTSSYMLSVYKQQTSEDEIIKHFKIEVDDPHFYLEGRKDKKFQSIKKLLNYYEKIMIEHSLCVGMKYTEEEYKKQQRKEQKDNTSERTRSRYCTIL